VLESLLRIRVPVVAVVDGPAVGAGLALAACADLVVATPDAVFGAPVARTLGNTLPPLVLARLFQRLGVGRTMGMALTARLLPATELDGFVTDVVERDQLDKHVDDVVQRICTNAPLTLSSLKEIERRVLRDGPAAAADDVLELVYGSRDFRAGVAGFLNHERVEWEGR
jgi:enoyl-CoA hydratase/carnithine racemase